MCVHSTTAISYHCPFIAISCPFFYKHCSCYILLQLYNHFYIPQQLPIYHHLYILKLFLYIVPELQILRQHHCTSSPIPCHHQTESLRPHSRQHTWFFQQLNVDYPSGTLGGGSGGSSRSQAPFSCAAAILDHLAIFLRAPSRIGASFGNTLVRP